MSAHRLRRQLNIMPAWFNCHDRTAVGYPKKQETLIHICFNVGPVSADNIKRTVGQRVVFAGYTYLPAAARTSVALIIYPPAAHSGPDIDISA